MTADGPESGTDQGSSWGTVLLGAGIVGGLLAIVAGVALAAATPPVPPVLVVASATSPVSASGTPVPSATVTFLDRDGPATPAPPSTPSSSPSPSKSPKASRSPKAKQAPTGQPGYTPTATSPG